MAGTAEKINDTESLVSELTTLKTLNKSLADSEARFKTIADNAPVLIWMSESDKLCSFFNKGWLDFTGRTLEQEMGNGWAEGVHPEDFDRCLKIYVTSFDQREKFSMEYRLKRFDGQYRWILDNGAPRYSPSGEFLGYIGSCIDIHLQKTLNQELDTNNLKLSLINSDLMALNYVASHDLQEPLRKINTYSELVIKIFPDSISPVVDAYLHKIKEEAGTMQTLIASLLEYTSLSELKVSTEKIDLDQAVNSAVSVFSDEIKTKGGTIEVSSLTSCYGNPNQLKQVFMHLLNNSLKFASKKRSLHISISAPKVISGKEAGLKLNDRSYLQIEYKDNGIGFENKYNEFIFGLFSKLKNVNNCGAGIGLSLVKRIVEVHNGAVFAYSKPDEGATFTIYLPI